MEVSIGAGKKGLIALREGDNAHEVATNFSKMCAATPRSTSASFLAEVFNAPSWALDSDMVKRLEKAVDANLKSIS
jgi:hypothetical protein